MNIIEIEHASFTYSPAEGDQPAGKNAVDDLSLSVSPGEFVAVLGHNGSGKSTLAKMLAGILLPQSGQVKIGGMATSEEERLFDIRRTCGMVFQNPDNQIVATVVEEDVAFALENMGVEPGEIRRRVDEALALVGMSEYASRAPHLLSGGQKQRVAIAGVLAMRPECIVMDEPTAMLDPSGRREVIETVLRLNREQGMTVVLITHHMDEAARSSRVVVMNEGRIVMDAPPEQIFSRKQELEAVGLAPPDTVSLLLALSQAGIPADPSDISEEACTAQLLRLFAPPQKSGDLSANPLKEDREQA